MRRLSPSGGYQPPFIFLSVLSYRAMSTKGLRSQPLIIFIHRFFMEGFYEPI